MTTPVKTIRRETSLVEHVCEHGIGHPSIGSADWMAIQYKHSREDNPWLVHGCDGCCSDTEWKIDTLKASVKIANDIIMQHKEEIKKLMHLLHEANEKRSNS